MARSLTLGAALMVTAALASCSIPTACNDAGFSNTLTVQLVGPDADSVDGLAVSTGSAHSDLRDGTVGAPLRLDENRWQVDIGIATPMSVTVAATDAAGHPLVRRTFLVRWHESDEPNGPGCGNRSLAPPLDLIIP